MLLCEKNISTSFWIIFINYFHFYLVFLLIFNALMFKCIDFYDWAHVTSTNKYDIMRADRPNVCTVGALYSYINLAEIFQESLSIFSNVSKVF